MWWSVWPEMCAECTCWNYNIFTCPEMDGWAECISAVSGQWPVSSWCLYQGSCLCGTVNNRGKVIYCYGDLVPRHSELFSEGGSGAQGRTSPRDLLAAQLGIWVFGLLALWVLSCSRASNEGSRTFHIHGEGPFWLKVPTRHSALRIFANQADPIFTVGYLTPV